MHRARGRDDADLAARGRLHDRHDRVVLATPSHGTERCVVGGARDQPRRGHQDPARIVRHLDRGALGGGRRDARGLEQDGATRGAELLRHLGQLVADQPAQHPLVGQDRVELLDRAAQLVGLALELETREPREPAELQVEDVVGLQVRQVEDRDQSLARLAAVLRCADQLDDLVDVEDRDQQAVDQVQAIGRLRAAVGGAAAHDVDAVVEVDLQHLEQAEGAGLAVDERDGVDAERGLEGGLPVQLLEQRLGHDAVLDLDHEAQAVVAVRQVLQVRDALDLLGLDELLDRLDDLLGADVVRQLGDDDALLARRDVLDPRGRTHLERAVAGGVGVADAVEPDDLAAGGQVRAGDEPHDRVEVGTRVLDQVPQRLHDLDEVVRRDVGGHADRDARRPVDQQVGQRRGQHRRLLEPAVVVRLEVDGVLVEGGGHGLGGLVHPDLGVAHRRGRVVGRAEVAVAVQQRQPQRPRLDEPHERVVDGAVAVRVQLAHDLADGTGALDVRAVVPQPHVVHRVEDAPLHGLEPVTRVGQRPGVDHGVGVLEEAGAHLVADVGVEDVLLEVHGLGTRSSHTAHSPATPREAGVRPAAAGVGLCV